MKKFFIFLALIIVVFAQQSYAAEPSCTQVMQNFANATQEIDAPTREKINVCNSLCKDVPNYKYAAEYCGIDDCKLEFAETGKVSDWCAKLSRFWNGKQGVQENPLAMIHESSDRQDFMLCLEDFTANSTMPQSCCNKLPEMLKYNDPMGKRAALYCSTKKAANACIANYQEKGKLTPPCCAYARANNNKFSGTAEFLKSQEIAETLDAAIGNCDYVRFERNYLIERCVKDFSASKKINISCCMAFNKGILTPDRYNMDYISLDKACNKTKY